MSTINLLQHYQISDRDKLILRQNWWYNWCWRKWGINFSELVEVNLSSFKWFLPKYAEKLMSDVEVLCLDHDIDISRWGNLWNFVKCNLIFAYKISKLIRKFAWYWERLFTFTVVFAMLNKYAITSFNRWKRMSLKYLLNNKNETIWPN